MTIRGWPAVVEEAGVQLRPLVLRDGPTWVSIRRHNVDWLRPWEATAPGARLAAPGAHPDGLGVVPEIPTSLATFVTMTRRLRREARRGRGLPFALCYRGELVGQLNVGGIVRGSLHSAHLGYWIDSRVAGRGVMPLAVALATDHCFGVLGLHRIEVNIRPENTASRRVVEKLGFRDEGVRERFLHIAGDWRDHVSYALTKEDVPNGVLDRWRRAQQSR